MVINLMQSHGELVPGKRDTWPSGALSVNRDPLSWAVVLTLLVRITLMLSRE